MSTTPDRPALSTTDVRFAYLGSSEIIAYPDLRLAGGEQLLLTGGSGTGKSTLLHLIAGLIDPANGRIEVGGQDIHALQGAVRDRYRGRTIGMIFQTFNLLSGFSALENVMAAMMFSEIPPREHRDRAMKLLRQLGIERPDAEPDKLSVGQQQRVAVARAVACDPILVLADEPTASLDPENAGSAMDLIQQICRERNAALLCTSHDPAMTARFAHHIRIANAARAGAAV
ncbi:MAG: ABC transporter ATP-binding protein [Phycisphaerales bacterium]